MILQTMSQLKKYNHSNELKIYLMNYEKIDFHQLCVFPYNILVVVKSDDGSDESHVYHKPSGVRNILSPGRYYFIPAGMPVEYRLKFNITYYTFHVGMQLYPGIDLFSSFPRMLSGDATQMLKDIEDIYGRKDEFLALCCLRRMLLEFFIAHWPGAAQAGELPADIQELMEHVKARIDAGMSVKTLADLQGITPEAFSRKFRRLVKMPPKAFLTKCLLERTTSLLCDSGGTVKGIARELDFSSEFYLSKFFKKHTGIAPSEYQMKFRTTPSLPGR